MQITSMMRSAVSEGPDRRIGLVGRMSGPNVSMTYVVTPSFAPQKTQKKKEQGESAPSPLAPCQPS